MEIVVSNTVQANLESMDPSAPLVLARDHIAKAYLGQWGSKKTVERARNRIHWLGRQVTGTRVLDVGCSEGILSLLLAREGFQVTGVDVNPDAIAFATELVLDEDELVRERVKFVYGNITTLEPPANRYDSIVIGEVIEHVVNPHVFMQKCMEHLKPGGRCVLTTPFGVSPHVDHKQTFFLSDIVRLLTPFMKLRDVSVSEGYIRVVGESLECLPNGADASVPIPASGEQPAVTPLLIETERATLLSQRQFWQEIDELQERKARLTEALREKESLEAELRQASQREDKLAAQNEEMTAQLDERQRQLTQAQDKAQGLSAKNADLARQTEVHRRQVAEATERSGKLEARLQELEGTGGQVRRLGAQVTDLAGQLEARGRDLEAARAQSESWLQLLYDHLARSPEQSATLLLHPTEKQFRLARAPIWITTPILPSAQYGLRGTLHAQPGRRCRGASLRVLFLDAQRAVIPPPYRGLRAAQPGEPAAAVDLPRKAGPFEVQFETPAQACYVSLGWLTNAGPLAAAPLLGSALRIARRSQPDAHTLTLASAPGDGLSAQQPVAGTSAAILLLRREGIFVTADVQGGEEYGLQGEMLCSEEEPACAALVQFQFMDATGRVIGPPLPGFATSDSTDVGTFKYIQKPAATARFTVPFQAPAEAVSVRLGFRSWSNKAPIFLHHRVALLPRHTLTRPAAPSAAPATQAASAEPDVAKEMLTPPPQVFPQRDHQPLAAGILDTMSASTFGVDCRLLNFTPHNWRYVLEQQPPEFLLVESAWQGNSGSWQYQVGEYSTNDRSNLKALVGWCREQQIPTVFWNKEDPVHFAKFKNAAKLFDFVFTTDANIIESYRALPNSAVRQVAPLMFSAQPEIHNPIADGPRNDAPCFAGSFYANRHLSRRQQMEFLLDAAAPFDLVIYDRNHGSDSADFAFPERFRPHIKGSLPYGEVVQAYKRHKIFLNVNSVVDSPTMFSRRVFELLACGTAVVSTPSVGISELFADIVQTAETVEEFHAVIGRLLEDNAYRRSVVRRGLRTVLTQHTTRHRLRQVAEAIGIDAFDVRPPAFAAVAPVATEADVERLGEMMARQTRPPQAVLLGLAGSLSAATVATRLGRQLPERTTIDCMPVAGETGELVGLAERVDANAWTWAAMIDPANEYDEWFFEDLLLCPLFTSAGIVGKAAHACHDGGGAVSWREGPEHAIVSAAESSIHPQGCLIAADLLRRHGWSHKLQASQERIVAMQEEGAQVYAADRDGFVASAGNLIGIET